MQSQVKMCWQDIQMGYCTVTEMISFKDERCGKCGQRCRFGRGLGVTVASLKAPCQAVCSMCWVPGCRKFAKFQSTSNTFRMKNAKRCNVFSIIIIIIYFFFSLCSKLANAGLKIPARLHILYLLSQEFHNCSQGAEV